MISALGFDAQTHFDALAQEKSGIRQYENKALLANPFFAGLVEQEELKNQFGAIPTKENYTKLEQLFILSISKALAKTAIEVASNDTLFIFSTTKGNIDLIQKKETGIPADRIKLGKMAQAVTSFFQNKNTPLVISNACISGTMAIIIANRMLRAGKYKNVVVTGGDLVSNFILSGFNALKALSNESCRPFDANRKGINLGEGCATVILSSENIDGQADALFLGGGISNDANHISGPSRTGEGLQIAIKEALQNSNTQVRKKDIDYISAHGTATLYNDEMEAKAFQAVEMSDIPMNSLKGYWGHTLGAAGLLEVIASIYSLKNNTLIASKGYKAHGVSTDIQIIEKTKKSDLNVCLKTSSGFGGCNAALILKTR